MPNGLKLTGGEFAYSLIESLYPDILNRIKFLASNGETAAQIKEYWQCNAESLGNYQGLITSLVGMAAEYIVEKEMFTPTLYPVEVSPDRQEIEKRKGK
jgi:hypothetical protein